MSLPWKTYQFPTTKHLILSNNRSEMTDDYQKHKLLFIRYNLKQVKFGSIFLCKAKFNLCLFIFLHLLFHMKNSCKLTFFKMATGVLGLQFQAVVYPVMEGPRPEPDLVTTHYLSILGKIVMEKAQKQRLAVSLHVLSVSISHISAFLECVLNKTNKLQPKKLSL